MSTKITVTIAALAAASVLGLSACASTSPSSSGSSESASSIRGKTINVAVYNNGAPAEYVENGKLTGWTPLLLEQIAEETGVKVNVIQIDNFSTIIPGLQSGRFDVAASNITVTEERKKVVDMVTTNSVGTGFATLQGSGKSIQSGSDMCGLKVTALAGSVYAQQLTDLNEKCAAEGKPKAAADLYPDSSAAVLAVQSGRADAYMGSYGGLAYIAKTSGKLEVQPYQFAKLPESMAFPKKSPYTKPFMDAINKLIENGKYMKNLEQFGVPGVAIETSELNPSTS